jgi:hypothetical protein
VKRTVALLQGSSWWIHELAEGVLKRFRWEVGVKPYQGILQPPLKHYLAVILPLGEKSIWRNLRAMLHLPAQL